MTEGLSLNEQIELLKGKRVLNELNQHMYGPLPELVEEHARIEYELRKCYVAYNRP